MSPSASSASYRRRINREASQPGEDGPRRVALACTHCRVRKIKCTGGEPVCTCCEAAGRTCDWIRVTPEQNAAARARKQNSRIANSRTSLEGLEQSGAETSAFNLAAARSSSSRSGSDASLVDFAPSSLSKKRLSSSHAAYEGPSGEWSATSRSRNEAVDQRQRAPSTSSSLQYRQYHPYPRPLPTLHIHTQGHPKPFDSSPPYDLQSGPSHFAPYGHYDEQYQVPAGQWELPTPPADSISPVVSESASDWSPHAPQYSTFAPAPPPLHHPQPTHSSSNYLPHPPHPQRHFQYAPPHLQQATPQPQETQQFFPPPLAHDYAGSPPFNEPRTGPPHHYSQDAPLRYEAYQHLPRQAHCDDAEAAYVSPLMSDSARFPEYPMAGYGMQSGGGGVPAWGSGRPGEMESY